MGNELQVMEQKVVNFNGNDLMAVKLNDGKIYAGVRWICRGIGLTEGQINNQLNKIQNDLVLSQGLRKIVTLTSGGE